MVTVDVVKKLIEDGENEYCDFKEKHHECNIDFIHDILCLINAIGEQDRYILYGVADDKSIIGIDKQDYARKQHDIVDLIKGSRVNNSLSIGLQKIHLKEKRIDVLIIRNIKSKPFFLLEDKKCAKSGCGSKFCKEKEEKKILRAGVVFTRNADTNTPPDSTATNDQIKAMWAEQFGISIPPLERIENYIQEVENWIKVEARSKDILSIAYYKKYPEFNIEFIEKRKPYQEFWEPWFENDAKNSYRLGIGIIKAHLKYHNTILKVIDIINVDYQFYFPLPVLHDGENYVIKINTTEAKVAAIVEASEINEDTWGNYVNWLPIFLSEPKHRDKFKLSISTEI